MNVEKVTLELYNLIDSQFNTFLLSIKDKDLTLFELNEKVFDFKCEINILKSQFILESFEKEGYKIGELTEDDYNKVRFALHTVPSKVDIRIQENHNNKILPILYH